jgi:hypothetical protein
VEIVMQLYSDEMERNLMDTFYEGKKTRYKYSFFYHYNAAPDEIPRAKPS